MQNDTENDDVRRRSRYYQGLLDSAKYVFTEQCREFQDLELGDGTTKIFLNMKSQNGNSALVSLLQYMKHTSVDNPDIKIWDERLIKIAQVVKEVKESEEWEEVKMGVMSVVMERGMEIGEEHGEMKKLVSLTLRKMRRNISPEETADMLETDVEVIRRIYEVAKRFAPDYDERKVSTELLREMKK